jgi:hypothetical protein
MARLRVDRGDTKEWAGQVTKPDANGVEQPYPIAGSAEIRFTAKRSKRDTDANAVIRKTWLAGAISGLFVDDPALGKYRVKIDPADTNAIAEETRLVYDVQLKDSTGTFTIDEGEIVVALDVTLTA